MKNGDKDVFKILGVKKRGKKGGDRLLSKDEKREEKRREEEQASPGARQKAQAVVCVSWGNCWLGARGDWQ